MTYSPAFLHEKIAWLKTKGVNVKSYEAQLPGYRNVYVASLTRLIENEFIILATENRYGLSSLTDLKHYIEKAKKDRLPVEEYEAKFRQAEINRALALVEAAVFNLHALTYHGIREEPTPQLIEKAAAFDLNRQERMRLDSLYVAFIQAELRKGYSPDAARALIGRAKGLKIDTSEAEQELSERLADYRNSEALKNVRRALELLEVFVDAYQETARTDEPDFAFLWLVDNGADRYLGASELDERALALAWLEAKGLSLPSGQYDKDERGYALAWLGRIWAELQRKEQAGAVLGTLTAYADQIENKIQPETGE